MKKIKSKKKTNSIIIEEVNDLPTSKLIYKSNDKKRTFTLKSHTGWLVNGEKKIKVTF